MRLLPDLLILGAGMHQLGKEHLEVFRKAVIDDDLGERLARVVASVESAGYSIGGAARKTVPRGYDGLHPRARFLVHDGLNANLEVPIPMEAHDGAFVDYCFSHFEAMSPVNAWLGEVMRGVSED
jgi:hypothetical protein